MKKVLFLVMFMFIISGILFAENQQMKTFDIGDGGIVKIAPVGDTLDVQIIYNNVLEAPELAKEKLGVNSSVNRSIGGSVRFSVKLLDEDGNEICQQIPSFEEFSLDQTDVQPKIILKYQTAQCGINSYDKVASVAVDYSNR